MTWMTNSDLAQAAWFLTCSGSIITFYIAYGFAHERIVKKDYGTDSTPERWTYNHVLLMMQIIGNLVVGLAVWSMSGLKRSPAPAVAFIPSSITYVFAMVFTGISLSYLSYPTQVLAKSCKPIPVIMMGMLFGKKFGWHKFVSVAFIIIGICTFMYKPSTAGQDSKPTSYYGWLFITMSLLMDGFTGPNQEWVMKTYGSAAQEFQIFNNFWGGLATLGVLAWSGEATDAWGFIQRNPDIVPWMGMFIFASALGQVFIFLTIKHFGSLTLSVTTTTRKFFTFLLSAVWFGHTFSTSQWTGTGIIFLGLGLDICLSHRAKQQAKQHKQIPAKSADKKHE